MKEIIQYVYYSKYIHVHIKDIFLLLFIFNIIMIIIKIVQYYIVI